MLEQSPRKGNSIPEHMAEQSMSKKRKQCFSLLEAESHIPWVAVIALLTHRLEVNLEQEPNYIKKGPFLTILHIFITLVLVLIHS